MLAKVLDIRVKLAMRRTSPYWEPRCPSCGSDEIDLLPFSSPVEWECDTCGMSFDQGESDDDE